MHSPKDIIQDILSDGLKLTGNYARLKDVCEKSGIIVDDSFTVTAINVEPMIALKDLFKNLMALPVIKIAAKMAARKSGVNL